MSETGSAFGPEVPPVVFDDSGVRTIAEGADAIDSDES